jgi:hypothetical protein
MIGYPMLGKFGRLGNGLFQVASTIGIAEKHGVEAVFPPWDYKKYFKGEFKVGTCEAPEMREPHFHFYGGFPDHCNIVKSYLQSEKYFEHCKDKIKALFEFRDDLKFKYKRKTIGISIRRGDYVDNDNYELLPASYYYLALFEHFPDWRDCDIMIFSDDIEYAKVHFQCLLNARFADAFIEGEYFGENETAIRQLAQLAGCDHFIIANSTFSWWGAWLGEKEGTKVIRPASYFGPKLQHLSLKDHYPERWIPFDHKGEKLDLTDVTFTIPVSYDSKDRKQNLDLSVCLLQRDFETNIIVGEHGGDQFVYFKQWCKYVKFEDEDFHRTKFLNEMCRMSDTPIVVNFDCDVILPPLQIYLAVEAIRGGSDMVYPYDGRFARVDRKAWFKEMEKRLDVGFFKDTVFKGMRREDALSVGGCVFVNKDSFIKSGMENENFISWSPEDAERYHRWQVLGFKVERINGVLYHMDHWVGANSSDKHPHADQGRREWQMVKSMNKNQLQKYVSTWGWANK